MDDFVKRGYFLESGSKAKETFFDEIKSVSSGFGSISYEMEGMRDADVSKLDILVAEEPVPAFTRIVSRRKIATEAEKAVEKLFGVLPRQMFTTKIQSIQVK